MKLLISIILIALVSFAMGLYLPWWSIAIAAFLVPVLIHQSPAKAFLSGFLGVFLLWLGLIIWISDSNDNLLIQKVAPLIISSNNTTLLIIVSSLIGGVIGGFASISGSFIVPRETNT